MSRERAVHWAPRAIWDMTTCGRIIHIYPYVNYAEFDASFVTCRVCLYHLGLYVPLVKLREHQEADSGGRAKHGKRDPFYQPPPRCMGCGRELVRLADGKYACPIYLTHGVSCCA